MVFWKSHKQNVVTLSSTETEYFSLAETATKAIRMTRLLEDLKQVTDTVVIHEDNQSCIHMLQNGSHNLRTKHIDIKKHFVCELLKTKNITIQYCPTGDIIADLLTKPLEAVRLNKLATAMVLE